MKRNFNFKTILSLVLTLLCMTGTVTARTYFVHNDHLGTPQVITDSTQIVVWKADYEPFGKANVTVNTITNNLRFPGQYHDQETGLHYNYFRDYDPTTGRYIQSDPIGLFGGLNTYVYVYSNPLYWIDPLGLVNQNPNTVGFGGGGAGNLPTGGGSGIGGGPISGSLGSSSARGPVGSGRSPMNVPSPQNRPASIGGRDYTGHALDRMQGRGIPPSAVGNAIKNVLKTPGNRPGTTQHHDPVNNLTIVTNNTTGRVITVRNGPPSNQMICP